jgi:multidrug resistance efflux pump
MTNNAAWVGWVALAALACGRAGADAPPDFQGVVELEELQLAFEYPGRLEQLWARRGARVKAGERLAAIDASMESAATRARRSETDAARSRLAVTRAGSRPEEVRALRARIRASDAAIRLLADNLARESTLLEQGVTPRAVVDELSAELERARAERDALEQNLTLLIKGARPEEVAAQASQAQASEALAEAQAQRERRFELYAPLDGEVLDHHFEPGELAAAGVPVLTLADTTRPFAEVFVPQAELAGIAPGLAARLWVDAAREPFQARVEHVARHTEFTPRFLFSERERPNLVVRVRVRIDDPRRELHAGIPARVQFDTPVASGALDGS